MKKLILTTLLLVLSTASNAEGRASEPTFCEWLGDSAFTVAQNRDNGIEEYDLIGKVLSEGKSYGEQSIVIPLIDRVYGIEKQLSPGKITFIEKQHCEIASVYFIK
jgi:hypothetical protein